MEKYTLIGTGFLFWADKYFSEDIHRGYTNTTMIYIIEAVTVDFGLTYWGAPKDVMVNIINLGERIN